MRRHQLLSAYFLFVQKNSEFTEISTVLLTIIKAVFLHLAIDCKKLNFKIYFKILFTPKFFFVDKKARKVWVEVMNL